MRDDRNEDLDKEKVGQILKEIDLHQPSEGLFDTTAHTLAKVMAGISENKNKPAQIRKFYDELYMWTEKAREEKKFGELLPMIKMMKAKVAYAQGRKLVSSGFSSWFNGCMDKISSENPQNGLTALRNFRTLFEAFLGFYKLERPND